MDMITHLSLLSMLDWAAAALMCGLWLLLSWVIENPPKSRPSVTVLMSQRRRDWMQVFVHREPRIFDSQILGSLRQGTSFFASTCIFAIGGVLALIKNTDPLRGVTADVTAMAIPALVIQIKLGLVALFLTNAFLKFVWANRVFGYCAVMMSAVPNDPKDPLAHSRAAQAGELNIRAALSFNRGLRAMYFALGALAWLLGPVALIVTTFIVSWIVGAREFGSVTRDILLEESA